MPDSPNLILPYIQASQAQKHITHNEAIKLLDGVVQLAVISRVLTAPPGSPADGDRYIVASSATGIWAGWDLNVAYFADGAWTRLVPRPGWSAYSVADSSNFTWNGSAWIAYGGPEFLATAFALFDSADPTKIARFDAQWISTGTTRTFTLPNISSTLAGLGAPQTFTGTNTFSGTFLASGTTATLGSSTAASTLGIGTGATLNGVSKTVNVGTGGVSGSTTTINIGSATAGALGTTTLSSPTVTFAATNTLISLLGTTALTGTATNATLLYLGLGGATADSYNRFSINTPALLLNNAGSSIDMTFNKNAVGNDASLSFKTGFSTRGLVGLLGDDDLTFKVSPDGSTFYTGFLVKATDGRPEFPQPIILQEQAAKPAAPASGKVAIYARERADQAWVDVQRASGRDFPLQPHWGVNRVAFWAPSTTTTVTAVGMPVINVGAVSTPTPTSTNLKTSMRRWTLTSAATINSASDQRASANACWRGNAAGLGGWTYTNRLALTTLQATGMAFFGLYGSTAALATTLLLSGVVNCVGIGFQRGTHTNWQMVQNDAAGAPTLTDLGASFAINTTDVLTLYIGAAPNGSSIGLLLVNETTGDSYDATLTTDIPANTVFLDPRNYMNNDTTAAAIAFDCAGVYLERDF